MKAHHAATSTSDGDALEVAEESETADEHAECVEARTDRGGEPAEGLEEEGSGPLAGGFGGVGASWRSNRAERRSVRSLVPRMTHGQSDWMTRKGTEERSVMSSDGKIVISKSTTV